MPTLPADLANQVEAALREDLGSGDVTAALVPAAQRVRGSVVAREEAVLCGRAWVDETFRQLDPRVQLTWHASDGERVAAGQAIFAGGWAIQELWMFWVAPLIGGALGGGIYKMLFGE